MDSEIRKITRLFLDDLKRLNKQGEFHEGYLNQYSPYQEGSRTHSKIQGVLAGIGYKLGYTVEIERKYGTTKKSGRWYIKYEPDCCYARKNRPIIFVEYESLDQPYNAIRKIAMMERYLQYAQSDDKPKIFLQIVTLPKIPISEIKNKPSWLTHEAKIKGKIVINTENGRKISKTESFFDVYFNKSVQKLKAINKGHLSNTAFYLCILSEDEFFVFRNSLKGFKKLAMSPLKIPKQKTS